MAPLVTESLYDRIINYIRDNLVQPGEPLPAERKLAELFQASRNSVREALRLLQSQGIVEVRKGSGCYVRQSPFGEANSDFCRERMSYFAQKGNEVKILLEQLEARRLFVPRLVNLAVTRMDEEHISRIESNVIALSRAVLARDYGRMIQEDNRFYKNIADCTDNNVISFQVEQLQFARSEYTTMLLQSISDDEINNIFAGYVRIITAIKKRDLAALEEHVQNTLDELQRVLEAHLKQVSEPAQQERHEFSPAG
jgi:DNA-binding FadR family transcriptional regulator